MNKFLKNSAIIVSIGVILFTGLISVKDYFKSSDLKGAIVAADIQMEKELLDLNNNLIETAAFGDTVKYKITITNNSTGELTDIEIEDVLPAFVDYVATSNQSYNPDTSDNVWNISSLPSSESATLEIIVKITGEMGDNIQNTAVMIFPILDSQPEVTHVFTVSCEWTTINRDNADPTYPNPGSFDNDQTRELLKFSDGTIWVSFKSAGVYQLDGNNILKHFTSSDYLIDNAVSTLFEDSQGNLWIGNGNGTTNRITKINDPTGTPISTHYDINNESIHSIIELPNGLMYFGTDRSLYEFDKTAPSIVFTDVINIPNLDIIFNDIATDGSKVWMWLAYPSEQLYNYNPTTDTWTPSLLDPGSLTSTHNNQILIDSLGNIWAHDAGIVPNKLRKHDGTGTLTNSYNTPTTTFTDMEEDTSGNIIITTSSVGAFIANPITETFRSYDNDNSTYLPDEISPISEHNLPAGVVINKPGEYYFGTNKQGINILSCNPFSISLDPERGSIDGGNTVTLTGEGFTHDFNEENMTLTLTVDGDEVDTENVTEDTLTYIAPAHDEGPVDVTLTLTPNEGDTEEGTTQYNYVLVPTTPKVHNTDAVNLGTSGRLVPITNLNPVFTARNPRDVEIDKFRVKVSNNDPLFNTNIVADFEGSFGGQWSTRMGENISNDQFVAQAVDSDDNVIIGYNFTAPEDLISKAINERNLAFTPTQTGAFQVFTEDGAPIWKGRIGTEDKYTLTDIAVTSDDKIVVVGSVTGIEDIAANTSNSRRLVADALPQAFFSVYAYDTEEEEYVQLFHRRDIDNSKYTDVEIDSDNNIILLGDRNIAPVTLSNNTRSLVEGINKEVFVHVFTLEEEEYVLDEEETFPIENTYTQTPVNIDINSTNKVIVAYDEIEINFPQTYRTIIQILDNSNNYDVLNTFIFEDDLSQTGYNQERHTGFVVYVDENDNIIYARNIREGLIFASKDNSRNLVAPAGPETTAITFIERDATTVTWTKYLDDSNNRRYNITDIASVDDSIYFSGSLSEQAQPVGTNNTRNLVALNPTLQSALVFSLDSSDGDENWAKIGGTSGGSISIANAVTITKEKKIAIGGKIDKNASLEWENIDVTTTAFSNNDRKVVALIVTNGFITLFDTDGTDIWNKLLTAGTTESEDIAEVKDLKMTSNNLIVSGGNALGNVDLNGNDFEDDDGDDNNGNPGEKFEDRRLLAFDQDTFVSVFDTYGTCESGEFCPNMEYKGLTTNNLQKNTEYYYQVSYWRSNEDEASTTPSTELSSFINKTTGGGGGGSSDPIGGGGGPRKPTIPRTEVVRPSAPSTAIFQGNNNELLLDKELEFQEGVVSAARMYNLLYGEGPTTLEGSIEFARQRGIVNPKVLVKDPHRELYFWEYIKMILHTIDKNSIYNEAEKWEDGVYTAALGKGIVDQSMLEQIDNVHEKITREMAMESAYRAIKTKNENFTLEEFFKSELLALQYKNYQLVHNAPTALRASGSLSPLTALHFAVLENLIKNNPNLKLENLPRSGYDRYSLTYGKLHPEFSQLEDLTDAEYEQLKKDFNTYQEMKTGKVKFFNE